MCRFVFPLGVAALGLALTGVWTTPAGAVVIATGDGSGNTTAPAGGSGWANMARVANASAVYLGDGWMITANHVIGNVGNSPVRFTNGEVIAAVPGSDIELTNPDAIQAPNQFSDLKMFQLASDPGLPALPIISASPSSGSNLMLIGAGRNRETNIIGWSISSSLVWTQVPLPGANARGFALDTQTSQMRWGMALSSGGTTLTNDNSNIFNPLTTATFQTNFSSVGVPFSAAAVLGDSGGGAFQFVNGVWQLAGIIDSMGNSVANQPGATVVFGNNQSIMGDLSVYRDQIEAILNQSNAQLQSAIAPLSASVASPDVHTVLLMINDLQDGKGGPISAGSTTVDPSFDVNADGLFNVRDVLQTINYLIDNPPATALGPLGLSAQNMTVVPEPSAGMLALVGVLIAGLARRVMLARRGQ